MVCVRIISEKGEIMDLNIEVIFSLDADNN
jgi:hypothetical protein